MVDDFLVPELVLLLGAHHLDEFGCHEPPYTSREKNVVVTEGFSVVRVWLELQVVQSV